MGVPAHFFLLTNQHLYERLLLIGSFDRFKKLLLAFCHRTPDAMPLAAELANIDTG